MSTTIVNSDRLALRSVSDGALKASVRFWFAIVVIGQLVFAFSTASFYGLTAVRGDWEAWKRYLAQGHISGDGLGNWALAIHLVCAVVIIVAGAIQLIPRIRERTPVFHRWNGRMYIGTAFLTSIVGLGLMWVRGAISDPPSRWGQTLNAILIMLCAAMALRSALARDFKTHRSWALRLYMVVSASLFIRAGVYLSIVLNRGPFGFDPATRSGPFLTFIFFAQSLLPLAVLEIYLRTQERGSALGKFAMAGGLFGLTIMLGFGILAATLIAWMPQVKRAYDYRKPVAAAFSPTNASDAGRGDKQYHRLETSSPLPTTSGHPDLQEQRKRVQVTSRDKPAGRDEFPAELNRTGGQPQ